MLLTSIHAKKAVPDEPKQPFLILNFNFPILLARPHCVLTCAPSCLSGRTNDHLPLPSPHIPIAALAANRVIIIVINITFLLLKPLNLLTSNTFYKSTY